MKERRVILAQSATLGYRWSKAGPRMVLVTSKGTRRWVVPKGGIKSGRAPHEAAAEEAFEEAGVTGRISRICIGVYSYLKANQRQGVYCTVRVYPMKVTAELPDWPERAERRREWVSFDVAAGRVKEKDLKKIILSFRRSLGCSWSGSPVDNGVGARLRRSAAPNVPRRRRSRAGLPAVSSGRRRCSC